MSLADLQRLEAQAVIGTYARNPVEFVRGEGTRLWDDAGDEYLDFLAGISVVQIGHCHPELVKAVREQAGRLMHVGNLFYTEPGIRLAQRLSERGLGGKAFLCNSGTEAIECALKLARRNRAWSGPTRLTWTTACGGRDIDPRAAAFAVALPPVGEPQ